MTCTEILVYVVLTALSGIGYCKWGRTLLASMRESFPWVDNNPLPVGAVVLIALAIAVDYGPFPFDTTPNSLSEQLWIAMFCIAVGFMLGAIYSARDGEG